MKETIRKKEKARERERERAVYKGIRYEGKGGQKEIEKKRETKTNGNKEQAVRAAK